MRVGVRVLRIALLTAFAVFALLSLLILVVVAEIAQGGDLRASDILHPLIVLAPTAALGWLVWREFRPLTAERLHAHLEKIRATHAERRLPPNPGAHFRRSAATFAMLANPRIGSMFRFDHQKALAALTADAEAAERDRRAQVLERWVTVGVLQAAFDADAAEAAFLRAHESNPKDTVPLYLLQRVRIAKFDLEGAERAGSLGRSLARTDVDRIVFLDNDLWTCVYRWDDRRVATIALEVARIAEKADVRGMKAVANFIDEIEGMAELTAKRLDFPQLRMMLLATVDIRRALAGRAGTRATKSALAAALIRAGEALVARANTNEGHALIAEGRALEASLAG